MSEPDQLYVQVRISKARFEEFLASPCAQPTEFADFQDWLADKSYSGSPITLEELSSQHKETVADWLAGWDATVKDYGLPPLINRYDDATQTWTFIVIDFSENYGDFVQTLAPLRRIADFKDIPGTDYILIYGFMFSGKVTATVEITPGTSHILAGEPPVEVIEQAEQALTEEIRRLSEEFDD